VITGIRQPHRRHADETVDNHYRQLYQIRRAHGDVISRVGLLFTVIGIYVIVICIYTFVGHTVKLNWSRFSCINITAVYHLQWVLGSQFTESVCYLVTCTSQNVSV